MAQEASEVMVRIKTTLKKFDGDGAYIPGTQPVEVIEREEEVPLSSLPLVLQQQLMEKRT